VRICPKDCQICIDDLCRGSGVCLRTGDDMLDTCDRCGQVCGPDFSCGCPPDDPRDDDGYYDQE
jgi:hypothetical protein